MNNKPLKPKISIIGAGNVGVRFAYSLMIKGLARQIVIYDINRKRLEGEVMDLAFGEPFVKPVEIIAGDYSDMAGSDIVVITAGLAQKPGQTRLDLVKGNVDLLKKIIPQIMKYSPESILMVVSNPVDVLSYAAYKISGKPPHQVIGSGTVLDTARFRSLLARKFQLDSRNIHAYILGEHGDSEFAVWSQAIIGAVPLRNYCKMSGRQCGKTCPEGCMDILDDVKNSAYEIIERKGETSYAIGLGAVRISQAIIGNENSILPISALVEDYMGINDVYLSLPAIVNSSGVREILKLELNDRERNDFLKSANTLKEVIREVGI